MQYPQGRNTPGYERRVYRQAHGLEPVTSQSQQALSDINAVRRNDEHTRVVRKREWDYRPRDPMFHRDQMRIRDNVIEGRHAGHPRRVNARASELEAGKRSPEWFEGDAAAYENQELAKEQDHYRYMQRLSRDVPQHMGKNDLDAEKDRDRKHSVSGPSTIGDSETQPRRAFHPKQMTPTRSGTERRPKEALPAPEKGGGESTPAVSKWETPKPVPKDKPRPGKKTPAPETKSMPGQNVSAGGRSTASTTASKPPQQAKPPSQKPTPKTQGQKPAQRPQGAKPQPAAKPAASYPPKANYTGRLAARQSASPAPTASRGSYMKRLRGSGGVAAAAPTANGYSRRIQSGTI